MHTVLAKKGKDDGRDTGRHVVPSCSGMPGLETYASILVYIYFPELSVSAGIII